MDRRSAPRVRLAAASGISLVVFMALVGLVPRNAPGPAAASASAGPVWHQTSFLIGGSGASDAKLRAAPLIALSDAGFDYVDNLEYGFSPALGRVVVARLDSLARARPGFRLKVLLHYTAPPGDPAHFEKRTSLGASLPAILANLDPSRGMNGPSVLGWGLWDEPATRGQLAVIHDLTQALRANPGTRGGLPYTNLNPIYVSDESQAFRESFPGSRSEAYARYLDAYLGSFDADPDPAPVLSFDHYPFWTAKKYRPDYLLNLGIAGREARAHGRPGARIPLWVYIQLSSNKAPGVPFEVGPTLAETRWQAWVALAYGAKGIAYWTVAPVFDSAKNAGWGPGILGWDHKPNDRFAAIAALNHEMHALGPTLMRLECVSALHVADARQTVPDEERIGAPGCPYGIVRGVLGDGREDCLLGYLKAPGDGDDYLLVVNKSMERARSFHLDLDVAADTVFAYDPSSGIPRLVAVHATSIESGAIPLADGRLYRLVTPLAEHLPGISEVRRSRRVCEYRVGARYLEVREATGARRWVDRPGAPVDSTARWTAAGLLR